MNPPPRTQGEGCRYRLVAPGLAVGCNDLTEAARELVAIRRERGAVEVRAYYCGVLGSGPIDDEDRKILAGLAAEYLEKGEPAAPAKPDLLAELGLSPNNKEA